MGRKLVGKAWVWPMFVGQVACCNMCMCNMCNMLIFHNLALKCGTNLYKILQVLINCLCDCYILGCHNLHLLEMIAGLWGLKFYFHPPFSDFQSQNGNFEKFLMSSNLLLISSTVETYLKWTKIDKSRVWEIHRGAIINR